MQDIHLVLKRPRKHSCKHELPHGHDDEGDRLAKGRAWNPPGDKLAGKAKHQGNLSSRRTLTSVRRASQSGTYSAHLPVISHQAALLAQVIEVPKPTITEDVSNLDLLPSRRLHRSRAAMQYHTPEHIIRFCASRKAYQHRCMSSAGRRHPQGHIHSHLRL